jgi:hypothetical protein
VPATNIASWDGVAWHALGPGVRGSISALAWWRGSLYISGFFDGIGNVPATNLARWDGTQWHPWSVISNGNVNAIAVWGDQLYLGGSFSHGGVSRVARWDGTELGALGGGVAGTGRVSVAKLAVGADGLYVAGTFSQVDGLPATNIARWNGSAWHSLGEGAPGSISALAVRRTTAFVGGLLVDPAGGTNHLLRWDGQTWSSMGSGIEDPRFSTFGRVLALEATEDGLFVGGVFTSAGGKPSSGIGRWVEHPRLRVAQRRSDEGEPANFEPTGEPGLHWQWETSSDLRNWLPLSSESRLRTMNTNSPERRSRFFRGVVVP